MNLMNRTMSYDKNKNVIQESCECEEYVNVKSENQIIEYPPLSEEEIEKIIGERYDYKDEKTKTFIRKALRKHGDKYDYSKVVYVKWDINVEIICRVEGHDSFLMRPDKHCCRGQGCSKCKFEKLSDLFRLTLEEFIDKSNEIHGVGRYDYSKVNYVNNNTEVIIICHNHEEPYEFKQIPNNHFRGQGCTKCKSEKISIEKKLTLEEFIEKANKIQGIGRYDYSKVKYVNTDTEVIIICPKHEEFKQKPKHHLQGKGCQLCKESRGAKKIRIFLINNNIIFEREKRFNDCRNIKPLPFDFYLPQYNLCIEFDGKQHIQNTNWYGALSEEQMKENLQGCKYRDQIKNEYCKNNGIGLLRLNNLKTVEKELTEYFQTHKIIKEQDIFNL